MTRSSACLNLTLVAGLVFVVIGLMMDHAQTAPPIMLAYFTIALVVIVALVGMVIRWRLREAAFRNYFKCRPPGYREKLSIDRSKLLWVKISVALHQAALFLDAAIKGMEAYRNKIISNPSKIAEALESDDGLRKYETELAAVKDDFWRKQNMAKQFGFYVRKSYKDYLKI